MDNCAQYHRCLVLTFGWRARAALRPRSADSPAGPVLSRQTPVSHSAWWGGGTDASSEAGGMSLDRHAIGLLASGVKQVPLLVPLSCVVHSAPVFSISQAADSSRGRPRCTHGVAGHLGFGRRCQARPAACCRPGLLSQVTSEGQRTADPGVERWVTLSALSGWSR